MAEKHPRYLDPAVINKISRLELRARKIVEGFLAGLHKSPYHGFSVEFAQHREYVPGDDLKYLDWKVYGKTDRLYLKQYEQETSLQCYVLLDVSESMLYGSESLTKFEYACFTACALMHIIVSQQDAASLTLFDNDIINSTEPSSSPVQLGFLAKMLEGLTPKRKTDMASVFLKAVQKITRRSLVVVVSDLFDDVNNVLKGLRLFHSRRHDVIVINVLDDYEETFPFQRLTLFDGFEEHPKILVDPKPLRKAYIDEVTKFVTKLKSGCLADRIDYVKINSSQPVEIALSAYMASRLKRRK